jgi:hypothetical protein
VTVLDRFFATLHARRRRQVAVPPPAALAARPPLLALPAPPGAQLGPVCAHCRGRHPPLRLAPTWSTSIGGTLDGRPRPLGRDPDADVSSLHRDGFNPWRWGVGP